MDITYKHDTGECPATYLLTVEHHGLVTFICPKCKWMAAFIPTVNYDKSLDFNHNKFVPVNEDEFIFKKKAKKKRTNSVSQKRGRKGGTAAKVISLPTILNIGTSVPRFPRNIKIKIKEDREREKRENTNDK